MSKKMKTASEVVEFVVNHYTHHPRSIHKGSCLYNGPNGAKCAFALCCKIKLPKDCEDRSAEDLIRELGEEIIRDDMRGFSMDFWVSIQALHDVPSNWGEEGLTDEGRERAAEIAKME